jgi:hypothetical protein
VELGTALRSMAAEVEAAPEVDGGDLWARGRARMRRRRALGAAVVAGLVVIVALAGLLVPAPVVVMPAGTPHGPALPKNIYTPSRWLAGTDGKGPLGTLAVLGRSEGRHGDQAFGISATTGEYRFLDLPDRVRDTEVALSPSGRYVAYWITGRVRHDEFPAANGTNVGGPVEDPVAGIGVYDTVDGSVVRHHVASDYGLTSDVDENSLLWLDRDTVMVTFAFMIGSETSSAADAYRWHVATGAFERVGGDRNRLRKLFVLPDHSLVGEVVNATNGGLMTYESLTDDLGPAGPTVSVPYGTYDNYSRFGDIVVVTGYEGDGGIQRLRTGVIGTDSRVADLTPVGTIVITELLGWRSAHSVLVAAVQGERVDDTSATDPLMGEDSGLEMASGDGGSGPDWGLYEVDLVSQKVHRLGAAGDLGQHITVAQDLLTSPMVAGPEPPHPLDPRLRNAGIAAGLIALGGVAFVLVRRRRLRG